ncbi:hypothetical protein MKW98_015132 [Papaver atlanticum]|uniref:Uncharacterized protein n=1 Tax=Papaver atlanticum TaxID=357466 RepID=A0AAD4S803_9MAGN|nr:hypothetical protein MKW98_015132 [Papaver atlanticum]
MERNFRIIFSSVFFFVVMMIMVSTTAARREKVTACVDKALAGLNKTQDFELTAEQLFAFEQIAITEIMKEPLEYEDEEAKEKEKEKVFKEIEESVKRDENFKDLGLEKVDNMILGLKAHTKDEHCDEGVEEGS